VRYPCAAYSTGVSDVELSQDTLRQAPIAFTTHYSSVELGRGDAVARHRQISGGARSFQLVTVATLAQLYKGPDVLIRAVADCVRLGWNLRLRIAGDGRHRPELESLAAALGISDRVEFLGQLAPGAAVREQLDAADLFVLPSRSEGLPRAMIEAMSRSLPCIGSRVGGIPELLPPEDLVAAGDMAQLSAKIREVLGSPERMSRMSARNLSKAQQFREEVLAARRTAFLTHLRDVTAAWHQKKPLRQCAQTAELMSNS
jgi:glycosyltransferase involved in cell wall biosynthesis